MTDYSLPAQKPTRA